MTMLSRTALHSELTVEAATGQIPDRGCVVPALSRK